MANLTSIVLVSALRFRNPRNLLSPLSPLHILHRHSIPPFSFSNLLCHSSISSPPPPQSSETLTPPPDPPSQSWYPDPLIRPRSRTPSEKQFETWVLKLKPGFTPNDVVKALQAQSDPDLALDLFRWAALQRGYKHNHLTYLSVINVLMSGKRYRQVETLLDEVLAGACEVSVPLYNSLIRFCCGRKLLFNRAFDVYKKMLKSENSKPTIETYSLLFGSVLRKFGKLHVCYVYLHAVRSLAKQMKVCGVIPDIFVLNMIIKAYAKCLEVDEALRVFREMGLYGCEPNRFSYSYIVKAFCEKGRLFQGLDFFKEMKSKGLVPKSSTYMILVCSLAMERMFDDAIEIAFDMVSNSMSPDDLTYKTLLEEFCRAGKVKEASELLEEFRKRDPRMTDKTYRALLYGLNP